jgi:hypothetical protein
MPRKTGLSRLQFGPFATPLEDMIAPDNPVRVVDAFVDSLDLEGLGFRACARKCCVACNLFETLLT